MEGCRARDTCTSVVRGNLVWFSRGAWCYGDGVSSSILEETGERLQVARLTVDQYERMIDTGILPSGAPIELLDGLLVLKDRSAVGEEPMTIGARHPIVVDKIGLLVPAVLRLGSFIRFQGPIRIPELNEPEPDAMIVRGKPGDRKRHPGPDDVSSIIEVADSSLLRDRTSKLRVYASAGVGQYVIVNLVKQQVEVYESPSRKEGRYLEETIRKREQVFLLAVGARKRLKVRARDLLP